MKYNCTYEKETWIGEVTPLVSDGNINELQIKGRGTSLKVVVGKYSDGLFVWIPDRDFGSALSYFNDIFWNVEHLCEGIGIVDAITVATGIKAVLG